MANDRDLMLWGGDFNQHHPLWDNNKDKRLFTLQATREEEVLISLLADEGLAMALPKGAPTLKHMVTNLYLRLDNVWCSERLLGYILRCEVDSYLQPPCTDHFPIGTIVNIPQERTRVTPSRNFREVDWDAFQNRLQENLEDIPLPTHIRMLENLQQAAADLTTVLQKTIQDKVKLNKPCPHSKRWWNRDLHQLKKSLNKLSQTCMKQRVVPSHPSHEERRKLLNEYGEAIIKAKCQHWMDYLEEAADHELWTANRYLREPTGDGGKTHIPTLKVRNERGIVREVNMNNEKAEISSKVFFPLKPGSSSIPEDPQYPQPMPNPPPISKAQVRQQIERLSPYKASRPDGISKMVLQKTIDLLEDYLLYIYQAALRTGTYMDAWREFTTIVLQKQGKPSYEAPKAYRPIALLCTMAKVFTAIIAENIKRMVEKVGYYPTTTMEEDQAE